MAHSAADDNGYQMVAPAPLEADDARGPRSTKVMQRPPEPVLVYNKLTLWSDVWAGRRDRKVARLIMAADEERSNDLAHGRQRLHTHRVQQLQHCSDQHAERERLATQAMLGVLDDQLAALYQDRHTQIERISQLDDQLRENVALPVTDEAVSAAEELESAIERHARRRREHGATVASSSRSLAAAHEALASIERDIDVVLTDRVTHWAVLLIRVQYVREYYNRRANTYLRAVVQGLKSVADEVVPDAIAAPTWAHSGAMPAPPSDETHVAASLSVLA